LDLFLKRNRRTKNGETYEYWSLVETVRTERGPRHRLVANLGKLPGLDRRQRHGWEDLTSRKFPAHFRRQPFCDQLHTRFCSAVVAIH
jgi:hypothetical protein